MNEDELLKASCVLNEPSRSGEESSRCMPDYFGRNQET